MTMCLPPVGEILRAVFFIQQAVYKFQQNDIAIIRTLEYNDIANVGGAIMNFMSAREAADK